MCLSASVSASVSTTATHTRQRERESGRASQVIKLLVLSGKFFRRMPLKIAVENELSAVILFMPHVSLPGADYFKAFKVL